VSRYNLVGAHAYTTIGVLTLSNGTKLVKMRFPWGGEKFNGPWHDGDSKWTDQFKKEANFRKANDGVFSMPIAAYRAGFGYTIITPDTSKMHHSYWLSLNDKNLGTPSSNPHCGGGKCIKNRFVIESDVEQTVWLSSHVHKWRQYVTSSCQNPLKKTDHIVVLEGKQGIQMAQTHATMKPITMKKGEKVYMYTDFSITAWGTKSPLKISHTAGAKSDSYPLQAKIEPQPDPKPDHDDDNKPDPAPNLVTTGFEKFVDDLAIAKK
jgi:hypothetical protein